MPKRLPKVTVVNDSDDPNAITSITADTDGEVELTHADGSVITVAIKAGVPIGPFKGVVDVVLNMKRPGNKAPRN